MIKKILISVFIISIIFFGLLKYRSYGFEKSLNGRPKESSWLVGDFRSYQSLNSVKKRLKNEGYKWKITERIKGEYLGYKYTYLEVSVKNFKIENIKGDLNLGFFNDRLESIDFVSADIGKYKKVLRKDKKVKFLNSNEANVPPRTLIFFRIKDSEYSQPVAASFDIQLRDDTAFWLSEGD